MLSRVSVPREVRRRIKKEIYDKAEDREYIKLSNLMKRAFVDEMWEEYKNELEQYGATREYIKDSIMKGYKPRMVTDDPKVEHWMADQIAKGLNARDGKVYINLKKGKAEPSRRFHLGRNLEADLLILDHPDYDDDIPRVVEVERWQTWQTGIAQCLHYTILARQRESELENARAMLILLYYKDKQVDPEYHEVIEAVCDYADVDLVFEPIDPSYRKDVSKS